MGGRRQGRLWLARALGLALALLILLPPLPAEALDWSLPRGRPPSPTRVEARKPLQQLQEVPPPEWVQAVQRALEGRDPRVEILAPADGSLLPDAPWTLRLRVSDWPLVDAGPLGLGPHLVVQLDGQPPQPVVQTEVAMPALSPGSHLLTVYAAKPWGEAQKSPAALSQIRLHRLAPNPATLPAPGTPQLLPVRPTGNAGDPPLLLDWLLIDAPLQGLRTETMGWRLRATINGESVLLDRQTPLWLRGWKPGSNAVLLELLDGRGEPLNPPFNSLLREVVVPATPGPRPHPGPLTPLEMAVLLGDEPPSALLPATPPAPEEADPPAPTAAALEPQVELQELAEAGKGAEKQGEDGEREVAEEGAGREVAEDQGRQEEGETPAVPEISPPSPATATTPVPPTATTPVPPPSTPQPASPPQAPLPSSAPPPAVSALPTPPPSAREEVNPDGTLKRPPRPSPLERLRERLRS